MSRISIHAPRTGSDSIATNAITNSTQFQSTLPARGATQAQQQSTQATEISIHAPRTGSDHLRNLNQQLGIHFNPRSPHGERRAPGRMEDPMIYKFQSTLPARGATFLLPRPSPA